jgi:hypothetical protein
MHGPLNGEYIFVIKSLSITVGCPVPHKETYDNAW